MKNTLTVLLAIIFLTISFGAVGFFFWSDIESALGLKKPVEENYIGKPFVFNLNGSTITIPDKFPEDVLDRLRQNFVEKGGMPLRLEEKGNGLPFGMP